MPKRIFITGASGFIGFHLASHLEKRGDKVIGYDNYNFDYCMKLKKSRAQVLKQSGISIIEGDILDQKKLIESISTFEPTHLIHLAAQAGVRESLNKPHHYLKTNIEGFLNILEVCRQFPFIKLIYASSSSVYGTNQKIPFQIEDKTDYQASFYGVTKKTNELMAETYRHLFNIFPIGLRFFTVYGPWGRPDMAYFSFANAILKGEPIKIYNNGEMERDFTYIQDIVEGVTESLEHPIPGTLFNLGSNRPLPLLYLIERLEKELNKKARLLFFPMQPGDVKSTYADIENSKISLKYSPKVSLEEGIHHFVRWHSHYREVILKNEAF